MENAMTIFSLENVEAAMEELVILSFLGILIASVATLV